MNPSIYYSFVSQHNTSKLFSTDDAKNIVFTNQPPCKYKLVSTINEFQRFCDI